MSDTNSYEAGTEGVVEKILGQAINKKASDIHIYPERGYLKVRLRVDGFLHFITGLEQYDPDKVISEIKVLSELNITERRLPQDGHLEFTSEGKIYNFRVSSTPTIYGESVVMRMLNREGIASDLSDFGFNSEQLESVDKIINSPFGIVLITGPTGSGKTTILYSFLNKLNKPEYNILTLEDPVEYQMNNVRQMQINESIGWDFARGMRAVVRQDPDIIMLGEIRDEQTAAMAFQAALTGRLVFSTFHTFDVPGIVIRLVEMGIPRSVVAHSMTGVITIRLVKKICQSCIADFTPDDSDVKKLGIPPGNYVFKKGVGCDACQRSGYSDRVGIFEVILFDDEIKENIIQEHPDISLSQLLGKKKFTSLRESAIEAVTRGITTPEEVFRVLGFL